MADDYGPMITVFRKGLSEAGYIEGKNVSFEYAWAKNHYDRLPAMATKLTERGVSLILGAGTPSARLRPQLFSLCLQSAAIRRGRVGDQHH